MKLQHLLQEFFAFAREAENITIYNKTGLLHNLANFLQQHLKEKDYGLQISRNAGEVVVEAMKDDLNREAIDLYVYQVAGKEQYAVQVSVYNKTVSEEAGDLEAQLQFLQSLKAHGFKDTFLLLVRNEHAGKAAIKLPEQAHWQELQPASQDNNGPWFCALISVG
ncbi:hypothetical protein [Botryobacter ruber]|uniref:hypothetical protein n=1 Tax=Botryobacter ruber TaxID=2171629 RepID=UPI000E09F234|nr:hypothetical protein [Botryobacter ruber]